MTSVLKQEQGSKQLAEEHRVSLISETVCTELKKVSASLCEQQYLTFHRWETWEMRM